MSENYQFNLTNIDDISLSKLEINNANNCIGEISEISDAKDPKLDFCQEFVPNNVFNVSIMNNQPIYHPIYTYKQNNFIGKVIQTQQMIPLTGLYSEDLIWQYSNHWVVPKLINNANILEEQTLQPQLYQDSGHCDKKQSENQWKSSFLAPLHFELPQIQYNNSFLVPHQLELVYVQHYIPFLVPLQLEVYQVNQVNQFIAPPYFELSQEPIYNIEHNIQQNLGYAELYNSL